MPVKGAVFVTGASTGIGEACAVALDQLGFRVFAGIRKSMDGESLRRRSSERITPIRLDISDQTEVFEATRKVTEALGNSGLAGLVNNAGIVVAGMLEFLPLDALRQQLEVNVVGQLAVTQAFLPSLRKARGRIVNMGSLSGLVSTPFTGAYAASKFAMEALTDALRQELRPWKIQVSIIEPGYIQTPILKKSRSDAEAMLQQLPAEAMELYGASMRKAGAAMELDSSQAPSPDIVVKAVVHALTARRPHTRYAVGPHSGLQIRLGRALPDRWRDLFIARHLGLK